MNLAKWNTIFLADDDLEDCEIFTDVLGDVHPGAQLTVTHNGRDLLQLLKSATPDILFLDLNMPLKSGYDCLKEIRSNEALKDLVVVIFTTTAQKRDIDMLYELGANLFITKPSEYSKLKNMLQLVLETDWLKETKQPNREVFALQ